MPIPAARCANASHSSLFRALLLGPLPLGDVPDYAERNASAADRGALHAHFHGERAAVFPAVHGLEEDAVRVGLRQLIGAQPRQAGGAQIVDR